MTLQPGTTLMTPLYQIHRDESIYPNPNEFDGFRFSKIRENQGESAKHHASNTSIDYLYFGHGQHAWYFPDSLVLTAALADFLR